MQPDSEIKIQPFSKYRFSFPPQGRRVAKMIVELIHDGIKLKIGSIAFGLGSSFGLVLNKF